MATLNSLFMPAAAFDKYLIKAGNWLGGSNYGPLFIKLHPLKEQGSEGYAAIRLKPSFYSNLFNSWTAVNKARAAGEKPQRVLVKTAGENNNPFPDFKMMIVASATGPEILLNDFDRLLIENKLGEIVEYISELIELINKEQPQPGMFLLEIRTRYKTMEPALIRQSDIINGPDAAVRNLLINLPGWGRPTSRAKPPGEKNVIGFEDIKEAKEADTAAAEPPGQKNEKYRTYEIFYGTSRKRNAKGKPNNFYVAERADNLEMGTASVSIPKRHQEGKIERPGWFRNLLFGESPEKDMVILDVSPKDETAFIQLLKTKLAGATSKDALIFIHGYNVSFAESIRRTAQLGYDLKFDGAVMAFTWPSKGLVKSYITDLDSAKYSSFMLKEFLEKITAGNTIDRLFFIAHSMGNVVLTEAMLLLAEEQKYPIRQMSQLVLAAPDVDQQLFRKTIAPAMIRAGAPRVTLYASSKDKALLVSQKIRNNYTRLGQGGNALFIYKGIDSVDASSVDTSLLGHGYFAETEQLIQDITLVLEDKSPGERKLHKQERVLNNETIECWNF